MSELEVSWTQTNRTAEEKAQQRPAPPLPGWLADRTHPGEASARVWAVLQQHPDRIWSYADMADASGVRVATIRGVMVRWSRQGKVILKNGNLSHGGCFRTCQVARTR